MSNDALTEENWAEHIRNVPGPTNDAWNDALAHANGEVDETVNPADQVERDLEEEKTAPLTDDKQNDDNNDEEPVVAGPATAALAENPSTDPASVIEADNKEKLAEQANEDSDNNPNTNPDSDENKSEVSEPKKTTRTTRKSS